MIFSLFVYVFLYFSLHQEEQCMSKFNCIKFGAFIHRGSNDFQHVNNYKNKTEEAVRDGVWVWGMDTN